MSGNQPIGPRHRGRSTQQLAGRTIDLLIIILGITVGVTIIVATIGTLILKGMYPEWDSMQIVNIVGEQVAVIVGALVGLIAGQASARVERQRLIDNETATKANPNEGI